MTVVEFATELRAAIRGKLSREDAEKAILAVYEIERGAQVETIAVCFYCRGAGNYALGVCSACGGNGN